MDFSNLKMIYLEVILLSGPNFRTILSSWRCYFYRCVVVIFIVSAFCLKVSFDNKLALLAFFFINIFMAFFLAWHSFAFNLYESLSFRTQKYHTDAIIVVLIWGSILSENISLWHCVNSFKNILTFVFTFSIFSFLCFTSPQINCFYCFFNSSPIHTDLKVFCIFLFKKLKQLFIFK